MYYVYITTNKTNDVLYIGVTHNLIKRVYEHKNKITKGFTSRYNVDKLVYYEAIDEVIVAIEKSIKGMVKRKKNIIN